MSERGGQGVEGGKGGEAGWTCAKCNVPLIPGQVTVTYLGSAFPLELPRCPTCGFVLVSEALATGKMLQAEQVLEDK